MSGVNRRDAEFSDPFDQFFLRIIRVNRAQFRLHRRALVERHLVVRLIHITVQPDDRARVNQTGRDDSRGNDSVIARNLNLRRRADGFDFSVVDKDNAVRNRLARHRPNRFAFDGNLRGRGEK